MELKNNLYLKHTLQNWCDLCHKEFELGKYEIINGKVVCDNCNPKKFNGEYKQVYVRIPK